MSKWRPGARHSGEGDLHMQYMLMIYETEAPSGVGSAEREQQMSAAYGAYIEALNKAGVVKGMNRLRPTADATTVRTTDGKPQVLDGPYADSKEQLGGYFLIDVPDLDAAISWAARCLAVGHGAVEVRPIWVMQP